MWIKNDSDYFITVNVWNGKMFYAHSFKFCYQDAFATMSVLIEFPVKFVLSFSMSEFSLFSIRLLNDIFYYFFIIIFHSALYYEFKLSEVL